MKYVGLMIFGQKALQIIFFIFISFIAVKDWAECIQCCTSGRDPESESQVSSEQTDSEVGTTPQRCTNRLRKRAKNISSGI